jgi:hypothetical protein
VTTKKSIWIQALQCPECGAPANIQPGTNVYHCNFCHSSLAIEHTAAEPPRPPVSPAVFFQPAPNLSALRAAVPKRSGGGAGCFIVGGVLLIGGVAAGVALFMNGTIGPWNGKTPLVCSGNERIVVDHVNASFPKGVAIDASGNCSVSCKDCQLSARTVIRARENATVHLDHGTADGTVFYETRDNADVSIDHTKTTGTKSDPAKPEWPPGPQKWPTSGPFVCGKAEGGTYDNVKIKVSSGAAIIASVNCSIKLSHCTIEGPVGILLGDNASIELDHCDVRATDAVVANANGSVNLEGGSFVGTDHAAVLVDNASLHSHGTQVNGSKSTSGNAEVDLD